jgi:hypothetical protein
MTFREEIEVAPTSSNGRCWTRSVTTWTTSSVPRRLGRGDRRTSSYPKRVSGMYDLGGGPHFGSGLTIDTAAGLYENKT